VDFKNGDWQVTRVQELVPGMNFQIVPTYFIHFDSRYKEVENKHKGIAQLTQLQKLLTLSNKGNIRIKKACIGLVEEVLRTNLLIVIYLISL
jgi:hypothetical protein